MRKKTIILAGGGTGGHITPLLAVAKKIISKQPDCRLVLTLERGNPNEKLIADSGVPLKLHHIFAGKFRRFHNQSILKQLFSFKIFFLNIKSVANMFIGFLESTYLILRYRPVSVFSKGSFASVPVCLAAAIFFRKIVTHDSDSVPGLANRVISIFASINAVGVRGAEYPYKKSKVVFTGVPVGENFVNNSKVDSSIAKVEIGFPKDSVMLFVGGSTQGARVVDDAVESIAHELLVKFPKLHIVHVLGRLNQDTAALRYKNMKAELKKRLQVKTFLYDQYKYAAAADVVITRSGGTAMVEYGVLGKACIVIPAEQLTGGHQIKNSKLLADEGAIILVREDRLGEELKDQVEYLLQQPDQRKDLGNKLKSITPSDAAERLATILLEDK